MSKIDITFDAEGNIKNIKAEDSSNSLKYVLSGLKDYISEIERDMKKNSVKRGKDE